MRNVATSPESRVESVACLCRVLFGRPSAKHKILHSQQRGEYIIYCPTCGFSTRPDSNLQSVKADWICSNRPGDAHIAMLWERRLSEIQKSAPAGALSKDEPQ